MKVLNFKELGSSQVKEAADVVKYLSVELAQNLREIANILRNLTFSENFTSFEWSGTVPASSEVAIRNELRGVIPSKRIIVRADTYGCYVVDGDTSWDANYVYLKNVDANDAVVTVIFLK
jgi:hypothetical protein